MDIEFFLILILDIALTAFGYLLVPTIYCLRKKPLTAKKIKKIIILNAICVCLVFLIIRLAVGGDARASVAVWLWSWVGHIMMKKHLLLKEESELDTNITPAEDTTHSIQSCNDEENKEIPETNDGNSVNLTALQIDATPMDTTDTTSTEEVIAKAKAESEKESLIETKNKDSLMKKVFSISQSKKFALVFCILLCIILYLSFLTLVFTERNKIDTYICYTTESDDCFHTASCYLLHNNIKEHNGKIHQTTGYEASKDYKPCWNCHPYSNKTSITITERNYLIPALISIPISAGIFLIMKKFKGDDI